MNLSTRDELTFVQLQRMKKPKIGEPTIDLTIILKGSQLLMNNCTLGNLKEYCLMCNVRYLQTESGENYYPKELNDEIFITLASRRLLPIIAS